MGEKDDVPLPFPHILVSSGTSSTFSLSWAELDREPVGKGAGALWFVESQLQVHGKAGR